MTEWTSGSVTCIEREGSPSVRGNSALMGANKYGGFARNFCFALQAERGFTRPALPNLSGIRRPSKRDGRVPLNGGQQSRSWEALEPGSMSRKTDKPRYPTWWIAILASLPDRPLDCRNPQYRRTGCRWRTSKGFRRPPARPNLLPRQPKRRLPRQEHTQTHPRMSIPAPWQWSELQEYCDPRSASLWTE
jgi:hypothetical protein